VFFVCVCVCVFSVQNISDCHTPIPDRNAQLISYVV